MNIVGNDETGMPSSLRPVMRYEHVGNIALVFGQQDALGLVDQNSRSLAITPAVSSRGRRGISVFRTESGRNPPRISPQPDLSHTGRILGKEKRYGSV